MRIKGRTSTSSTHVPVWVVLLSILVWLLIWEIAALLIHNEIFLPDPLRVLTELGSLFFTSHFWGGLLYTLFRVLLGLSIGSLLGILCGYLANLHPYLACFLNIPMKIIRAVPVASLIILAFFWVDAFGLTILITACMVMPILYTQVLSGFRHTDIKLMEMALIYQLPRRSILHYIQIPAMLPYLYAGLSNAIGLAFKSGVAAEVIAQVSHSIGSYLYQSKIYLETPALFAWTIAIVLSSFAIEKILITLVRFVGVRFGGDISHV